MTNVLVTAVEALADDVLRVSGYVDGEAVEAYGWQSAMTNHFDPSSYQSDGHRAPGAEARTMTPEEARAYCERLLRDARPQPAAPPPVAVSLDALPGGETGSA